MKEDIILIGFGGHGKSVIDSLEAMGQFHIAGYIDVEDRGTYHSSSWLGTNAALSEHYNRGIHNAVVSIGYMGGTTVRDRLTNILKEIGYRLPVIIDPSAVVAKDVKLGEGTFVGKRSIINSASKVGKMCIINSGAIVEHENEIGDFTHVAVNAALCGAVKVGSYTLIGAGTTVIQGVTIGDHVIVGAGSVVLTNVQSDHKVYGLVNRGGVKSIK